MTLRELYEMIGNSTIPPDAEVEVVNGELKVVGAARPLPPAPSDPMEPAGITRTSRGLFSS